MASERDTDADWDLVARDQPYWGVLSVDKYKNENLSEESMKEFFQTGEALIGNVIAFVKMHIDSEFEINRSLDFGCGVGRLLLPLAARSVSAVGVDVADEMLSLCNENIKRNDITNAKAVKGNDDLSNVEGTFNFINSYIVLQHIPPSRGYSLIAKLLSKLEIGGVGSIQLTYCKHRQFFAYEARSASYYRRDGGVIYDLGDPESVPEDGNITMYDYDLNQIMVMISLISGTPVMLLPTNDDNHLGVHLIFKRSQ